MNRLHSFHQLTETLENLLEQGVTTENRDTIIDEINHLMEQRANLFVELRPPFTKEEKLMGPKIVAKNRTIKKKMHMLFSI